MSGPMALLLVVLAVSLAAALIAVSRQRRFHRYLSAEDKATAHVKWHEIEQRMKKGGATQFRQAIIEADQLVDHCLKQLGAAGDTMGERLRQSQPRFSDYQGLWDAHKTRNQIVHEMDRKILSFEAKRVLAKFKTALQDLGVL